MELFFCLSESWPLLKGTAGLGGAAGATSPPIPSHSAVSVALQRANSAARAQGDARPLPVEAGPSRADELLMQTPKTALLLIDVRVLDHLERAEQGATCCRSGRTSSRRPHHGINLVPPIARLSMSANNLLTLHI
jgi:hypothetical protein